MTITKERIEELIRTRYEEAEAKKEYWFRPTHWIELPSGSLPLQIHVGRVRVYWPAVLEHGKYYIRFIEDFSMYPLEARQARINERVRTVGGSYPW
jgi:hypothetical protein